MGPEDLTNPHYLKPFRMLLGLDSFMIDVFRLGSEGGNALPVVLVLLVGVGAIGCCPLVATPVTFTL